MIKTTIVAGGDAPYDTIDVAAAKKQLRESSGDFDLELEETISAAIAWCEAECRRTLRTEVQRRTTLSSWDELAQALPVQPVLAIEDLTYIDGDGEEQVVAPADYRLITSADGAAAIELADTFQWPSVASRSDAIRLDWSSGYDSIDDVPPLAKQAVKAALTMLWGDLTPSEMEAWEKSARDLLGRCDWGCYR